MQGETVGFPQKVIHRPPFSSLHRIAYLSFLDNSLQIGMASIYAVIETVNHELNEKNIVVSLITSDKTQAISRCEELFEKHQDLMQDASDCDFCDGEQKECNIMWFNQCTYSFDAKSGWDQYKVWYRCEIILFDPLNGFCIE